MRKAAKKITTMTEPTYTKKTDSSMEIITPVSTVTNIDDLFRTKDSLKAQKQNITDQEADVDELIAKARSLGLKTTAELQANQ